MGTSGSLQNLKSRAVQSQGCERGVCEVAAARKAEGLQPVAAPADLHHASVRNARAGLQVEAHELLAVILNVF